MPGQAPMLSIIVPSYNVETYLEHGLSSYDDDRLDGLVQVVVVNDGSTDGTRQIAERFVEARPAVFTLVNKENGGHGSAVNAGIDAAAGKYCRVIDGDDWANTDDLCKLAHALESLDCDLVCDVKQEVDMSTGEKELFPFPDYIPQDGIHSFDELCSREDIASYIMIHTLMVRTDYARSINLRLLEKTFYVDFEYVVKATLDARDIRFLDLNVTQYLVGNSAQSVADDSYVRRWDDHTRVTQEILRLYEDRKGALSETRRAYLQRRAMLICNTHYNIALIFDKDRKRGMARAKEFRRYLRNEHPDIAALTEKRYRMACVLHHLGVDSQKKLDGMRRG